MFQIPCDEAWLQGLPAPVKNHYFYGMLLTEGVLRKDQRYFDSKRWLLNRLALGEGVLAGLDVDTARVPTSANGWTLRIHHGVAIDGYGREIVVPLRKDEAGAIAPAEAVITSVGMEGHEETPEHLLAFLANLNEKGAPNAADYQQPFWLEVQIAYIPKPIDPAPVKAGRCGNECEPSALREQFRLRVRKVPDRDPRLGDSTAIVQEPSRKDSGWSNSALDGTFPLEPDEAIRHRGIAQDQKSLVEELAPSSGAWVTIALLQAQVDWSDAKNPPTGIKFLAPQRYYRQIFSNDSLSRLLFALADRVDESSRVRVALYDGASANGRSANVFRPVMTLRVKIADGLGTPPSDHASLRVRFEIQSPDGGQLSLHDLADPNKNGGQSLEASVDANGMTSPVHWRFGRTPGNHSVSARVMAANPGDPPFHPGSPLLFHAVARPTAPTIIGMELRHWHTVHDKCIRWNKGGARLRIVFSRKMDEAEFQAPKWLKAWRVYSGSCHPGHQDPVHGPEPVILNFAKTGPIGSPADLFAPWFAEYEVPNLMDDLHEHFTLRMLVGIRADNGPRALKILTPLPLGQDPQQTIFPETQVLDADFAGSFLSLPDRCALWDGDKLADKPSGPDLWERFERREQSLPSGDGVEGATLPFEFHKTFEFSLPRCC